MSGLSVTPALAPRPERGAPGRRPQVIYIMGAGRSGSSVLGITLGNCTNVFFAGELDNWLLRSGRPQLEDSERSRFWDGVRAELEDEPGASELFGSETQRSIERSISLFRVHRWPARHRLRRRYRAIAEDLYRALTRVTGVVHIVDSSHYPLRARELQRLSGIDLHLVFLVRDPQDVAASFNRRDVNEYNKSTFHTNVYLWLTHLLSMLVFLRHPRERRLLVRYEDFLGDPQDIVRQILDHSGCADAPPADLTALAIGFPLQGNRVTRSSTLSLKVHSDPLPSSRLTAVLQAPLMMALSRLRPAATAKDGETRRGASTAERTCASS